MSGWHRVNLRRLATLGTGHTPSRQKAEYWVDCRIPWLTLADVWQLRDGTKRTVTETSEKVSKIGLANSAAVLHPAGTVAMSRTASVGFSCILGVDMATSQDYVTWTCGPNLRPHFLLYALRGLRDEILGMRMGSTHQTIYMPDIERIAVPVPPVWIQERIADFLDVETARIDALIAKKRRLSDLAVERLSSVIELQLRTLATQIGERRLKMVAEDITVGIVITPSAWYVEGDGVPALRGVNVKPGRIDVSDLIKLSHEGHGLHRKSALRAGDVVVVRTGQAGAAAVVPDSLNGANCIDLLIVRPGALDSRYLSFVLNSDWTQKHVEKHSVGAIQAHFNVGSLAELPIPTPSVKEQAEFVPKIDRIATRHRATREKIDKQIALLREHRQALITAAVTGEMEVPGVPK
jgi:type I restriction enzyme, S subunit